MSEVGSDGGVCGTPFLPPFRPTVRLIRSDLPDTWAFDSQSLSFNGQVGTIRNLPGAPCTTYINNLVSPSYFRLAVGTTVIPEPDGLMLEFVDMAQAHTVTFNRLHFPDHPSAPQPSGCLQSLIVSHARMRIVLFLSSLLRVTMRSDL